MLAILLAVVALLAWLPPAHAAGQRISIAVYGDSVVEGYTTPNFVRNSLIPQLRDALAARGFARGGEGLIPTSPDRWVLGDWVTPVEPPPPTPAWTVVGLGGLPVGDGPSGYHVTARSPDLFTSAPLRDPEVSLLYTTTRVSTPFRAGAGGRVWDLDAYAPGPPRPVRRALDVPPGARTLFVQGPRTGTLRLAGVVARRPPPASGIQVEVNNLGHAGRFPQFDGVPRVLRAIADQGYDVTVLMWGYNSELAAGGTFGRRNREVAGTYEPALLRRARVARASGGQCLIADSTPLPVSDSIRRQFSAIHRRVARRAGCVHTSVLARLWTSPSTAYRRGITRDDRVHPTARTYGRMARALAPLLERLVRRRAAAV